MGCLSKGGNWRGLGKLGLAFALSAGLLTSAFAQGSKTEHPAPIDGRWLTASGNLEVQIAPCGKALCGTVVKVLANHAMNGPGSMHPADSRPALGMQILNDFVEGKDGKWAGSIYNRENGKSYPCKLSAGNSEQLIVVPYVSEGVPGNVQVWTRVAAASE
jgi:uncharacterized protein (DUF2147 family)